MLVSNIPVNIYFEQDYRVYFYVYLYRKLHVYRRKQRI